MATSHLLQENEKEYNFNFAIQELEKMPVVVNFCRREQGILVTKGNPKKIISVADFAHPGVRIVNRPLGTGTRLLLDRELKKAGINVDKIEGYHNEVQRHLDVGLEILSGRSDAGPGVRAVASLIGLEFISLSWERYDLLITKERFFDHGIQLFLGILHKKAFHGIAKSFDGYDVRLSGKMVFPQE